MRATFGGIADLRLLVVCNAALVLGEVAAAAATVHVLADGFLQYDDDDDAAAELEGVFAECCWESVPLALEV